MDALPFACEQALFALMHLVLLEDYLSNNDLNYSKLWSLLALLISSMTRSASLFTRLSFHPDLLDCFSSHSSLLRSVELLENLLSKVRS